MKRSDLINSVVIGLIIAISGAFMLSVFNPGLLTHSPSIYIVWLAPIISVPLIIVLWISAVYRFGRKRRVLFQLGKFAPIGLSNTSIDFAVLNLLIFVSDVDKGLLFSVFKSVSFLCATANSYVWNKFWTFESWETRGMGKQFFRFLMVAGGGFVINVSVASLIVNFIEPAKGMSPVLWANIGAFTSLAILVIWDFTGYKFLVFKK